MTSNVVLILVWTASLHFIVDCRRYPVMTSTLEENGRRSACPGEVVIYTCKVGTPYLQWAVETFHHIEEDPIVFTTESSVGSRVIHSEGLFNATVVGMDEDGWTITSNLSIHADKTLHNRWIQCSDGYLSAHESPKSVLTIGGSPTRPRFLNYSITSHGVDKYSVRVEWKPPDDIGGVAVSNYTITLITLHKVHIYIERNTFLDQQLSYNQMYWFYVAASTCVNTSSTATLEVFEISCSVPFETIIGPKHEGSNVTFLCLDDSETYSIQCTNGTWFPDPSQINCSQPIPTSQILCGYPHLPANSRVILESVTAGSVAIFQCHDGFEATGNTVSVCSSKGEWLPDPSHVNCFKSVECGIPIPPTNGTIVNYTGTNVGSKAFIQCKEGLQLQGEAVSECGHSGRWTVNTSMQLCINNITTGELTENCDINLIVMLTSIALVIPFLVFIFCILCFYLKRKHAPPKNKISTNTTFKDNDIPTKQNNAYDYIASIRS